MGNTEEKAKAALKDSKLLNLFRSVERMNEEDKTVVTKLIGAFVFQQEMQQRFIP